MKNTKLFTLFSVAIFALTGCNKKCSKEEFVELANKTETHLYKKASVTVKGNSETDTSGMTTKYTADDTFKFKYSNRAWDLDGDYSSLNTTQAGLVTSIYALLAITVRDLVDQESFKNADSKELTCYSDPFSFRYNTKDVNTEESLDGFSLKITGPADTTYTFDKESGVIIKYAEKSDVAIKMTIGDSTTNTKSKTNMLMTISYSD